MATLPKVEFSRPKPAGGFSDRLYGNYTETVGSLPSWSLSRMLWQSQQIWREFLPSNKSTPIFDVGCGGGQFLLFLKNVGYSSLYGVDTSADQVAVAKSLGLTSVSCGLAHEYLESYRAHFGVVSVQNVLEHLTRDEVLNMLDLVHESLAEDGQIWIVIPNALSFWGPSVRWADLTHELAFTPQSISQALVTCGFTDIQFRELRPLVHGVKSFVRLALWKGIRTFLHLWHLVEYGGTSVAAVYTHDMQVVAKKARSISVDAA